MRKFGLVLILVTLVFSARASDAVESVPLAPSPIPAEARQLLLVQSASWNARTGTLKRYVRSPGAPWSALGEQVAVNLGRNGMAWGRGLQQEGRLRPRKREGDQRSPAGVFLLGPAFGYDEALPEGSPGYPYLHVGAATSCIEDSHSKYYNQVIEPATVTRPDWKVRDEMLRPDGLFRWGVVVQHNSPDTKRGAGSCIFLHIWRGPAKGTAGCTAMPPEAIEEIVRWLDPTHVPVMVQLPQAEYARLRLEWMLP